MSVRSSATLGAYRHYVATDLGVGKILHISGITSGEEAPFDISKQTEIIFEKIYGILNIEGGDFGNLVKINAYLVDIRQYHEYNEVRNRIFSEFTTPPASATIGGAALVRAGNRIEIDGVAFIRRQ